MAQQHATFPSNPLSQAESRVFELQQQSPSNAARSSPMSNMQSTPITNAPPGFQQPADTPLATTEAQLAHDHAIRQRRLGRACDACSKRKAKCGDVVPCRNCLTLGATCTFARPAKRRGPANRVAEDLKRARFEVNDLNSAPGSAKREGDAGISAVAGTMLGSPTASNGGGAAMPAQHAPTAPMLQQGAMVGGQAGVEVIAPLPTVQRMVYDFFTYVYPLFPFPHEHLVQQRLKDREDVQNRSFCALVATLLATLTSVFPRVAQNALLELEQNGNVIAPEVFIGRCTLVCEQARGPLNSGRNVDDAATAFFLGIVSYGRGQARLTEAYMAEALGVARYLGVEENGVLADGMTADYVTKELCRRLYWAVYDWDRLHQGSGRGDIVPLRKDTLVPPPPLSTDDYYIYIDRINQQPQGQLSSLDGFVLTSQIYATCQPLLRFALLEDEARSWESTQAQVASVIVTASQQVRSILASGHPELASLPNPRIFEADERAPSEQARMHVRWEIQKIMLRVALVVSQTFMAGQLVVQLNDENKDELVKLLQKCKRDAGELVGAVTAASLEPVIRIVAEPFGRVLREMKRLHALVGDESGVDEIIRRSETLIGIAR